MKSSEDGGWGGRHTVSKSALGHLPTVSESTKEQPTLQKGGTWAGF